MKVELAKNNTLACKSCNETILLTPMSGRYGYFVKCGICEANTPLKKPCRSCSCNDTKASKRKNIYTLKCSGCGHEEQLLPISM